MTDFLVCQIRLGKITIDDVPAKWRDDVRARLGEEV